MGKWGAFREHQPCQSTKWDLPQFCGPGAVFSLVSRRLNLRAFWWVDRSKLWQHRARSVLMITIHLQLYSGDIKAGSRLENQIRKPLHVVTAITNNSFSGHTWHVTAARSRGIDIRKNVYLFVKSNTCLAGGYPRLTIGRHSSQLPGHCALHGRQQGPLRLQLSSLGHLWSVTSTSQYLNERSGNKNNRVGNMAKSAPFKAAKFNTAFSGPLSDTERCLRAVSLTASSL